MMRRALLTALCAACLGFGLVPGLYARELTGPAATHVTALVPEQCWIVVPPVVTFDVTDSGRPIASADLIVKVGGIALEPNHRLRLTLRANAPKFAPPVRGVPSWTASDLAWNGAHWENGRGVAGNLSSETFQIVALSLPNPLSLETSTLHFTLKPNSDVQTPGRYTLTTTWRVESF